MKNEHAVSFFIFNFQKKGMKRMQVRWLALNNYHLFHSQTLTSFNSTAAPVTLQHSAYWRQTDEIVCTDGNIRVPFNKGLFFVFLTCRFQKAWIMSWEAFIKSRFDEGGGVLYRNSIPCAGLCRSLISAPTLTLWAMIFKTMPLSRLMQCSNWTFNRLPCVKVPGRQGLLRLICDILLKQVEVEKHARSSLHWLKEPI